NVAGQHEADVLDRAAGVVVGEAVTTRAARPGEARRPSSHDRRGRSRQAYKTRRLRESSSWGTSSKAPRHAAWPRRRGRETATCKRDRGATAKTIRCKRAEN